MLAETSLQTLAQVISRGSRHFIRQGHLKLEAIQQKKNIFCQPF
jgi:hypothetical protein